MISAIEQDISKNPEDAEAWIKLGNICFDSGRVKKAIGAYEKALELNPKNANVLTDLGVMYRRDKQPEKAVEAFDKAITADPHHEVSRFNKGIVLMHDLKNYEGAIREWNELVKMNPMAMTPGGQTVKEMVERIKESMNQQKNG
ncbi:MAG: tetratricopeptide repeat protein [Desulfobacteraceae bacterium]|nr:tetratricopeptide repeat protein [Desulfobacteraceae bacterium]